MLKLTRILTVALFAICTAIAFQPSSANAQAEADLSNLEGEPVGSVTLEQTLYGTLLRVNLRNLPEGAHAFHIHAVGECEPPFTSARGHYNPEGYRHGLLSEGGLHAGDMPNIHVPASGELQIEIFNTRVALDESLFDEDGAAIVIHAGPDDYRTDPAGAAGPRIVCGVIEK
jgi:Cu-Zn family superoxide dismutase